MPGDRRLASRGGRFLGGLCRLLAAFGSLSAELLREPLDAAFGVDQLLLAGEERMAGGADFEVQLGFGRLGLEAVAARATRLDFVVFRVDSFSHSELLAWVRKPLF